MLYCVSYHFLQCPPCRAFTPKLAKFYESLKAAGKEIEIIFVSGDNSEDEFEEYLSEMPWVAVPYGENSRREKLNSVYEVSGMYIYIHLSQYMYRQIEYLLFVINVL